jgi:hypothetical protein
MLFLTPEQVNATRQSVQNGDWIQGARIATGPLRSSFRRIRKGMIRGPVRGASSYAAPAPLPVFFDDICPLYVPAAADLQMAVGLERLFSDVDRQIRGEFRLAGGGYKKIEFGTADQFSEAEDQHAFDRLYWAARYARAAAFGHSGAIAALRSSWTKWLQTVHGPAAFAAYTVAERIASLSECLFWMRHYTSDVDADETISLKRQIWNDAYRLSANIEYGLGVHNHLLNDARGLFRASRVLPDLDDAAAWREKSFRLWDEFFPKLILGDGSFAEQSSHYQLLLCRTALEYFLAARLSHRALPAGSEGQLTGMFHLANDLLRPDGSLPRFGDNSPDHTIEDLWGLMAAAYHCGLLKTRPRHDVITPLTLLYCGEAPRLPAPTMPSHDSCYPQGGFMFLRSIDDAMELTVHADPQPEARAHGDSGRGSFELWWRGHIIVREPGSILSSSNSRSAWSRSGLAQNVTCLNGLAPGVTAEDRNFLPSSYANQGGAWVLCRNREICFRWDGFQRIRQGIVLWRTWHFDAADNLFFEERIDGSGEVQFQSHLCLGDGGWELARRDLESGAELQWIGLDGSSVTVQLNLPLGVNVTLAAGWCLPEFGMEQQAPVLVLSGNVKLPIRWMVKWQFRAASQEISSELSQQCAG